MRTGGVGVVEMPDDRGSTVKSVPTVWTKDVAPGGSHYGLRVFVRSRMAVADGGGGSLS